MILTAHLMPPSALTKTFFSKKPNSGDDDVSICLAVWKHISRIVTYGMHPIRKWCIEVRVYGYIPYEVVVPTDERVGSSHETEVRIYVQC